MTPIESPIESLVRLLDATADDRWYPGHPATRPRETPEDRAHDLARPADPTADTVADPARQQLADEWRAAMDYVRTLARLGLRADTAGRMAQWAAALHYESLYAAWQRWAGPEA